MTISRPQYGQSSCLKTPNFKSGVTWQGSPSIYLARVAPHSHKLVAPTVSLIYKRGLVFEL
ncbi:hypothetical protein K443DRAFT_683137 [Laccaria amethystina LaAM-08-1]|uniref:Uncharacterized protein n=1 Tax=Laccaria amethystina LaAM-08-1 TaxID=1095629 RepID=A0A0C9XC05_9AGAR|nr:hypothetical protein K443DRAFT_683137 [Laccaria amethystina LaAM-08-1]